MTTNTTTQRFNLRSIERVMSWTDEACFKIATVMLVQGQVQQFVRHAPTAVMHTFNKHPKMRATQVRGEFAIGEIHPHVTLEQLAERELVQIRETDADGLDGAHWHRFVQEQVDIPFDRYTQFPFCLHVWVDAASDQARLFLFSDHYLSDGSSGNIVLNDVLTFASALSLESASRPVELDEQPVLPGLYHATLDPYPVLGRAFRFLVKMAAKKILKSAPAFTPLITPRADQQHFSVPPPNNSSTLLFAEGTEENLTKLLSRCREENTTFFGALTAAVLLGYVAVSGSQDETDFRMSLLASFNMRSRVHDPIPANSVGSYATGTPLSKLTQGGIDVSSKRFWDVAREAKQETIDTIQNFPVMAIPMALLDQVYNAQTDPGYFHDLPMPYSSSGDVMISSVGRYAYKTSHAFRDGESSSDLAVKTLHYSCRTGYMAPMGQFYVSSVKNVCYGYNHVYDEHTGKQLFETVVEFLEHAGDVSSTSTLKDVLAQVAVAKQERGRGAGRAASVAAQLVRAIE